MIIDRVFIIETLRTALAVTVVIISIFLVTRAMGFLGQAADGLIPVSSVFGLVGLKMISYLDVMLPLMFYIALIMVLNRRYSDREMTVLASAGVGILHFFRPMVLLVLTLGGVVVFLSFYLTPLSIAIGFELENKYRKSHEISGVVTGKFVEDKGGNGIYFVERYNRKTGNYEDVFYYRASFNREGVVVAQNAYRTTDAKTQDQFLVLLNGTRHEGNPGSPDYRVINFEKYAIRIESKNRPRRYLPLRARPSSELMRSENPRERSEWYWRVAKIFTLPILSMFALGLCYVDTRNGKSGGMVLAFIVYLTYTNLLGYTVALVRRGDVNTGTLIWLVHASYFMLASYCLYRRNHNLPLLPQFRLPQLSKT